ncbi:DNA polymerase [Clostridium grantii]|uniref:DNA-directed DNA polymerase n=1 Tax=Clostridium grantii DSM 8605 TaxID=1121316 RepID=A0A1M5U6P7_9CLOT|nr:DNA polymerase [Clostridium grantii]SHH58677.1 DNA polymerase [Clostridium grantii DSM 8605]
MKTLSIDLETFSNIDLKKSGVYRYCESKDFTILLFGYSIDGDDVKVIDLACGEKIPQAIIEALTDDNVTKWGFNVAFERICLSAWLRKNYPEYFKSYNTIGDTVSNYLDPASWKCSMVWSAYNGLPLSLEGVGAVLGLQEQKMKNGRDLIRYFCVPCKPTKTNGGRTRNLPMHDTLKWATFVSYNRRDVEVEMSIQKKLAKFPVPEFVWYEYHIDQKINDRGIAIDMGVVEQALIMDERSKAELSEEMKKLTNLDNPNSVVQMKRWLSDNGVETDTLGKKAVTAMLKDAPQQLTEVLTLRQQLAKSSVKKYQVMQNAVCTDSRARGMFFFYGANRSGRWAGRLIQLQNLPQNHMPDLEQARNLVKSSNYAALEMLYDSVPEVLSELIRTAFIPRTGYKFAVLDYSSIEARVLSHLAQETWRNNVFANNGDIYCASASAMFGVPVEKHGRNSHLRQKGKQAELACGYGGSVGALKAMGALDMGLNEEDLQPLVNAWRTSNHNIVRFWWDVDNAVKIAIKQKITTETHGIYFIYQSGMIFIKLPSGRKLAYVKPKIGTNQFGGESVTYEGIGATKKWERIESYGPKFVENIVQAISRDILSFAMGTLKNYFICGHVHDELIIECSMDESLNAICKKMGRTPPWIKGLQLNADGYETMFYCKKD